MILSSMKMIFSLIFLNIGSYVIAELEEQCSVNKSCVGTSNRSSIDVCPVMFQCDNSSTCKCAEYPEWMINCSRNLLTARAIDCTCVMYDSKRNDIVVGYCMAQCGISQKRSEDDEAYYDLPGDLHSLNSTMCGRWNRQGLLCGQCKHGFYPQAYSYDFSCISKDKCKGKFGDVLKYVAAAYVPLTAFYFIIIVLRINVTSSYLLAFVVFSQTVSTPYLLRPVVEFTKQNNTAATAIKIVSSLYAIWSLDFFRSAYSICLKLEPLTVATLEYGIALYPLILHYATYNLIKLYDRKIPLVVTLWRPVKTVLGAFHKNVNSRRTVIDAFATFFLLSYSKVITISFTLLMPNKLYSVYTKKDRLVLFYDGTKDYFHHEHLPYAITAIIMCVTFNLIPFLMLLFFHTKCFQKLLTYCSCKCLEVKATMNILQCCYKDGTEQGTRDCRWFSATFPGYWIITYSIYAVTPNVMTFIYATIWCVIYITILVLIQPYNKKYHGLLYMQYAVFSILTIFFLLIAVVTATLIVQDHTLATLFSAVFGLTSILPLVLLFIYTIYCFFIHCKPNIEKSRR